MRFFPYVIAFLAYSGAVHAQSDEVVSVPAAGVEVAKPADWEHPTPEQAVESFRKVEIESEKIRAALAKSGFAPIVTFTKYPASYEGLNPTFKIGLHAAGTLEGRSASDILTALMRGLKEQMFPDLVMRDGPADTSISGLPAAYGRTEYTLTISGVEYPTISEIWIVPRGTNYFLISASARQGEVDGIRAELRSIVESVRIDPPS
jgi:hypothetical protein